MPKFEQHAACNFHRAAIRMGFCEACEHHEKRYSCEVHRERPRSAADCVRCVFFGGAIGECVYDRSTRAKGNRHTRPVVGYCCAPKRIQFGRVQVGGE